jgi:hypothetical protein
MRDVIFHGSCQAGCGRPIKEGRKFCSLGCSSRRYMKYRMPCRNGCGHPSRTAQHKYCSATCRQDYQFRTRVEALENGRYLVYNCNVFVRKYLIRKLGESCARCGWSERHPKTGRIPIEVEHIDGDWANNRPENLTLLCPNCHALTPTYRGLNRGRGRAHRLGGRKNPLEFSARMPYARDLPEGEPFERQEQPVIRYAPT